MRRVLFILFPLVWCLACTAPPQKFDVVLQGGRVIDPESGLDAIRNVGIRGDTIVRVSTETLEGSRIINASGLIVAPGFIDLHQHGQSQDDYRTLALDGVTSALELEVGVPDVRRFVAAREGKSPINFGAAASYLASRVLAWDQPLAVSILGPEAGVIPKSSPATNEPPTPERIARITATLNQQIEAGGLGIGMGLEYAPGATRHEVIEVFRTAAKHKAVVFVHLRSGGRIEPGSSIEALGEVIAAAAISGAGVHMVHVNSTCTSDTPECLSMMAGARERGVDVTTEAYPYTAGMTFINSALFNPGWRERKGLDYNNLELPDTGERLTQARFEALHAAPEPRLILIHTNPEELVDVIIANSNVMIASDGLKDHPRGAGTHSRILARYVRDKKTISINDAIRKMALMPAQRLEKVTPDAKRLGRLQENARADIVLFDPNTIQDRATFRSPTAASEGVRFLVVSGSVVVNDGRLVDGVAPGRAILGKAESKQASR